MSMPKKFVVDKPFLAVGCTLGEAPLFDPKTGILHFVDIAENKVFHLHTDTQSLTVQKFEEPVTCLALRQSGEGLACVTAGGFALIEDDSRLRCLHRALPPHQAARVRFNDGACDAKGRFFAGTICSPEHGIPGQLWMFDPSTSECKIVDEGPFTDSNGLGWSPDGKTMYFTDSLNNYIYAYDYDDEQLTNRRIAVDAKAQGLPSDTYCDGLCIDEDGYIWSARWGGSSVIRFSPGGHVDAEIQIPSALHVTACCFGGPNDDQLYITTAHCKANGGDAGMQEKYPDSGHLFVADLSGHYRGSRWRHAFGG